MCDRLKRIEELMKLDPSKGTPEGDELCRLVDEQVAEEERLYPELNMGEPPGTILIGSMRKRAYLYVCQTESRMLAERAHARQAGVQDVIDFVFEFDGQRFAFSYEELKRRLQLSE